MPLGVTPVIHGVAVLAVHGQVPAVMVMAALAVPPAALAAALVEGSDAEQPAAWFTVKVWPAMVMVPLRAAPVLADTEKFTVPEPVPLAVTPLIHGVVVEAVHGHAAFDMVTLAEEDPAVAATLVLELGRLPEHPEAWFSVKLVPPAEMVADRAGPVLAA